MLHPRRRQVEERSNQFWNYSFVSSTVREYKDSREVLPAPFNTFSLLLRLGRRLLRCGAAEAPSPLSSSRPGYLWLGGSTQSERLLEARRHRRKQVAMCAAYVKNVEEAASASVASQVSAISERQADLESKQEQRLESVVG